MNCNLIGCWWGFQHQLQFDGVNNINGKLYVHSVGIKLYIITWQIRTVQATLWNKRRDSFYNGEFLTWICKSYVYWTVHRVDSWMKTDQLDVICFIILLFTAQHVSNVSTSIFRSLRLIVDLFHVLYCCGSMCAGVTVWFGWGGVVSLCKLKH